MIEKVLKRELVFKGSFLNVYKDTVELPDGKQASREFFQHTGASVILAKNEHEQFLILKQYRHALQAEFFEFPAGRRDGTEEFLVTAQRELKEETGYQAKNWTYLGCTHPCIGYANEVIHIYLATDLTFGSLAREEGEHIEVFWKTKDELKALIKNNELTDAKSLSVWAIASEKIF